MRIEAPQRNRRLISLTPLIDVVFILLIFFMLASTFTDWQVVTVNAPGERTAAASQQDETPLRIRVEAHGLLIDGESLGRSAVDNALRRYAEEAAQPRVELIVVDGARIAPLAWAIDAVAGAAIDDVSVLREGAP